MLTSGTLLSTDTGAPAREMSGPTLWTVDLVKDFPSSISYLDDKTNFASAFPGV